MADDSELFLSGTSVPARIGATWDLASPSRGVLPVRQEICRAGVLYASALMMLSDTFVGMSLEREVAEDWTFTTDYSLRRPVVTHQPGTVVEGVGRPLRHGSRLLVDAVEHHTTAGDWVGHAQITFMRTPMRPGDVKIDIETVARRLAADERRLLDRPLPDAAGVHVERPGVARLEPGEDVRRPGGFVQGAIITLLGEMAALSLAEDHHGGPCAIADLDVRYLMGGRTGPLVATARWLGAPGAGRIAVDTVDAGHGNVVTTTQLATVAAVGS